MNIDELILKWTNKRYVHTYKFNGKLFVDIIISPHISGKKFKEMEKDFEEHGFELSMFDVNNEFVIVEWVKDCSGDKVGGN